MRFDKAVALVALAFCVGMAPKAQAAYIVDLYQDGSNVVATGSGSLDVRDLAASGTAPSVFHGMNPQIAFLTTGPGSIDDYGGISGPTSFGFGGGFRPAHKAAIRWGLTPRTTPFLCRLDTYQERR